MANNRYYMLCPCGSTVYLGKSLGHGIHNASTGSGAWKLGQHEGLATLTPAEANEPQGSADASFLQVVYEWMWEHLMNCAHPACEPEPTLGNEWLKGEIFKVITEYDERFLSGAKK